MVRSRRRLLAGIGCLLLAAACGGGGGGGGGAAPDAFSGTWHYAGYLGELVAPDPATVVSDLGTAVGDGLGGLTLTHRQNVNGAVGGVATDGGLAYGLASDGSLTWTLAPGATEPVLGGVLSSDARLGLLSSVTISSVPSFRVLLRRAGTFTQASLSGDYHTVSISHLAPSDASFVGTTSFAAGSLSYVGTTNREGAPQGASGTASYTVSAAGDLTVTNPGITLEGGVLEGGQVAVVAGGTNAGSSTVVRFYVREATAASLLTLAGTYDLVVFITSDFQYATYAGSFVADGTGGWTATLLGKAIGQVVEVPDPLETGTYTVTPDGTLTVQFSAASTVYAGGVSADGAFAVAGGPPGDNSKPAVWILVRR